MVRAKTILAFVFLLILCQGCLKNDFVPTGDYDEPEYTYYETTVPEISGLCFTTDKSSFMAVSDRGLIYEIDKNDFTARKLPLESSHDLEGITMNHATGEIYVVDEAENSVYKLSANEQSLTEVAHITIPNPINNKGLEGISYGNDTLYIVNQAAPTRVLKYCLSTQTTTYIDVSFAWNLSDICYDNTDNTLWIVDSHNKIVSHCNLNAEILDTQSIDYIAQAEGIVVDREAGYMWICCDTSSKIYKIKIKI